MGQSCWLIQSEIPWRCWSCNQPPGSLKLILLIYGCKIFDGDNTSKGELGYCISRKQHNGMPDVGLAHV